MVFDIGKVEECKENIVPLKRGRGAAALVVLDEEPEQQDSRLDEERARWEADIRNESSPDPLAAWHGYAKWWQQQTTRKAHPMEFQQYLERATRKFFAETRYKSDYRYLTLWLMYGEHCLKNSVDMFPFLWANGIGQTFGLFYMAWASVLEKARRFEDTEDVYKMGLARKAEPFVKLQEDYDRFQVRMVERVKRDLKDQNESDDVPPEQMEQMPQHQQASSSSSRQAFNPLSGKDAKSMVRRPVVGGLLGQMMSSSQPQPVGNDRWGQATSCSGSSVPGQTSSSIPPASASAFATARNWTVLSPRDELAGAQRQNIFDFESEWSQLPFPTSLEAAPAFRSENVKKAVNWDGMKAIPAAPASSTSSSGYRNIIPNKKTTTASSSFELFCDDEFQEYSEALQKEDERPHVTAVAPSTAATSVTCPSGPKTKKRAFGRVLDVAEEKMEDSQPACAAMAVPGATTTPGASDQPVKPSSSSSSRVHFGEMQVLRHESEGPGGPPAATYGHRLQRCNDQLVPGGGRVDNRGNEKSDMLKMQSKNDLSHEVTLILEQDPTSGPLPAMESHHDSRKKSNFVFGFLPSGISIEEMRAEKFWDAWRKKETSDGAAKILPLPLGAGRLLSDTHTGGVDVEQHHSTRKGASEPQFSSSAQQGTTSAGRNDIKRDNVMNADHDVQPLPFSEHRDRPHVSIEPEMTNAGNMTREVRRILEGGGENNTGLFGRGRSGAAAHGVALNEEELTFATKRAMRDVGALFDDTTGKIQDLAPKAKRPRQLKAHSSIIGASTSLPDVSKSQPALHFHSKKSEAKTSQGAGGAAGSRESSIADGRKSGQADARRSAVSARSSGSGKKILRPHHSFDSKLSQKREQELTGPLKKSLQDRMLRQRSPSSGQKRPPGSHSKPLPSRGASPSMSLNNSAVFGGRRDVSMEIPQRPASDENAVPLEHSAELLHHISTSGGGGGLVMNQSAVTAGTGGGSSSSSASGAGPPVVVNNNGRIISGLSPRHPRAGAGGGMLFGNRPQIPLFRSNSNPRHPGEMNSEPLPAVLRRDNSGSRERRRPNPNVPVQNVTQVTRADFAVYDEMAAASAQSPPARPSPADQRRLSLLHLSPSVAGGIAARGGTMMNSTNWSARRRDQQQNSAGKIFESVSAVRGGGQQQHQQRSVVRAGAASRLPQHAGGSSEVIGSSGGGVAAGHQHPEDDLLSCGKVRLFSTQDPFDVDNAGSASRRGTTSRRTDHDRISGRRDPPVSASQRVFDSP
ncbi:unnamed protein product [Amoebophrya sp. A120]|nr:unnamed protein product [Amoebophrya sp. A120]|eukprot:GSA120T00006703001.1